MTDDYAAFIGNARLMSIVLTECKASRFGDEGLESFTLGLQTSYRVDSSRLDYRFDASVKAKAGDDKDVAELATAHVVSFEFDSEVQDRGEWVVQFGEDVALMAAYPYIRSSIQNLAGMLDLPGLTLQLLKRGELVGSRTEEGDS